MPQIVHLTLLSPEIFQRSFKENIFKEIPSKYDFCHTRHDSFAFISIEDIEIREPSQNSTERNKNMGRKRMTFWMEDEQIEGLRILHTVTRIPQAVLMREAIDDLLTKYHKELQKAKKERR